jgi:TRAP-type C4-dicarboxylate transport system substrate-binding protein
MPSRPRARASFTLALLLAGSVFTAAPVHAQEAKPVELRYAAGAPQRSVWGMQVERFAKAVDEESKGTVKIVPFLGGQLGSDVEIIQQVARGRIDMAGVPVPFAALLVPELQLTALPTYFRNAEELDCVMDGGLMAEIENRIGGKGLKVISWGESGALDLVGKRAFASPSDLAGTKAGTSGGRIGVIMWEALKANPVTVQPPEATAAFQTGLIDVTATVAVFYVASGMNKVAPVLTRTDLFFIPSFNLMNRAAWERLSPEQQAAIERARRRTGVAQQRREVREFQAQMRQAHVAAGGQLVEPDAAGREAYRRAMAPAWPAMVAAAGPDGPGFFAVMDTGRKACAR